MLRPVWKVFPVRAVLARLFVHAGSLGGPHAHPEALGLEMILDAADPIPGPAPPAIERSLKRRRSCDRHGFFPLTRSAVHLVARRVRDRVRQHVDDQVGIDIPEHEVEIDDAVLEFRGQRRQPVQDRGRQLDRLPYRERVVETRVDSGDEGQQVRWS